MGPGRSTGRRAGTRAAIAAGTGLGLALLTAAAGARAADLELRPVPGRFLAVCEDLGQFCGARACGRDQIEAALACRARCPSSVTLRVAPAACPLDAVPVLRRRG